MADLAFLQAVRDTLARSTMGNPNPAVMAGISGQVAPPTAPAPGPSLPPQAQQALNAGDALFQRLGPQFDPLVSGMQRSFGYGAAPAQSPPSQLNPTTSGDPSVHSRQPVPYGA